MPVKIELNKNASNGVKPVKIYTRDIEQAALTQLKQIAQLPIVHSHVAAMPDVHPGIGATVGLAAHKTINVRTSDVIAQTQGVEYRKDKGVIDEIPSAYKDIDTVMENQSDLVEVVHTLKQVLCIKG